MTWIAREHIFKYMVCPCIGRPLTVTESDGDCWQQMNTCAWNSFQPNALLFNCSNLCTCKCWCMTSSDCLVISTNQFFLVFPGWRISQTIKPMIQSFAHIANLPLYLTCMANVPVFGDLTQNAPKPQPNSSHVWYTGRVISAISHLLP